MSLPATVMAESRRQFGQFWQLFWMRSVMTEPTLLAAQVPPPAEVLTTSELEELEKLEKHEQPTLEKATLPMTASSR